MNHDDFEILKGASEPPPGNLPQREMPGENGDDATANYQTSDHPPPIAKTDKPRTDDPCGNVDKTSSPVPQKVGRYAVKNLLGRGGFGEVYLAFDEQLKREVAIKLTFGSKVGPAAVTMFLAEAQMLADLDHPNIVPVFDIGTTQRGDIFIVSKLIDGTDLAQRIEQNRPSREQSLEIIATIADALHHAHCKGLIHRDIKPANILLDRSDRPYLADFGIALRETDQARAGEIAGTPAYMSPEQARGEGHLMTPQSDIYSLGVVLYELLSGRRPFRVKSAMELMKMVQTTDIRTPRTYDATISRELERVCLKALARRPSDRFAIAKDFADEVRYVLSSRSGRDLMYGGVTTAPNANPSPASSSERARSSEGPDPRRTPSELPSAGQLDSDLRSGPVRVLPKGLRSFDESDSDFFLELLPGPFDRTGMPEGLRFWKNRIEASQVEQSFRVGLVYGPSGCGKSSLMKAGLLPRLSPKIETIYIEATPDDTTGKLLRELHKRIPEASGTDLAGTLSLIRRKKLVPSGGKLLLVIDQFEQWLYAHKNYSDAELTNALRQCDGTTVQAIVMVRDDFWLSVSRFLRELDIPILERENSALVDLFDIDHAKKVLALLGRAYDKLPDDRSEWTEDQKQFLQQAAQGLSQEEKVISVRLALFAEMMKSKSWSCKTLADLGGIAGVGVQFLQETFGAAHAPIQFRQHQEGVRAFLAALLPPIGSNIKGHSRPLTELQRLAGYDERPREFSEMVSLLDKNLRLITPTDEAHSSGDSNLAYQLTHDYLVPSLREWLTQKQRETKKGRAELKLAERATTWGANPEAKQLPTLLEWFTIRRLTESKKWSDGEQRLMRSAGRYHGSRLATVAASMCMLSLLGTWGWNRITHQRLEDAAAATADRWLTLEPNKLGDLLPRIRQQAPWISDDLRRAAQDPTLSADQKSRAMIGLDIISEISAEQWSQVADTMLEQSVDDFVALCKLLQDSKPPLSAPFQSILASSDSPNERKLLAAAGLAFYDPDCEAMHLAETGRLIADGIATTNPIYLRAWQEAFHSIAARQIPFLQNRFRDVQSTEVQKNLVATVLADYAKDNADKLAELLAVSDPANYKTFLGPIRALGAQGVSALQSIASQELKPQWNDPPLDPSWKEVDAATKLSFEQARGRIDERFAFVQAMPLEQFLEVAESLRASGYRPTRVRPWAWASRSDGVASETADGPLVAAVFTRDGKRWEIDANLKMVQIPTGDRPAAKGDLVLDDVSALPTRSTMAPNFIALWTEPVSDQDVRHSLLDVDEDELRTEDGKTPGSAIRVSVRSKRGGTRRYNAIYSDVGRNFYWQLRHAGGQLLFRPQRDMSLAESLKGSDPPEPFMGIWDADTTIETRVIPEDPNATGRTWIDSKQVAELVSAGWRPTAIALADWGGESEPRVPYGSMIFARPLIPEELKESTAKQQARALIALYELGEHARVWSVMQRCLPDARVRSLFQSYLASYGADPQSMVEAFLGQSPGIEAMRSASTTTGIEKPWVAALAISLGDFHQAKMLTDEQQGRVRTHALKLLAEDVDPGVHGACEWLLKQLGAQEELQSAQQQLATGSIVGNRNWYRTKSSDDTFVVLGPAEFVMGSPISEAERYGGPNETDESQHRCNLEYRFAIASTETTVEQFQRFRANHAFNRNYSRDSDAPANRITWFDAVAYCNWLSQSEGIPKEQHCYQIDPKNPMDVVIPEDMLKRTGYRLSTEAEWEYACRAQSVTARPYGETKELLTRFAWYADNSGTERAIPVGTMRPNDFGLFDMLGNIFEWNHDFALRYRFQQSGKSSELIQPGPVDLKATRLLRGGSFDDQALFVRSSDRHNFGPTVDDYGCGFRASRTYP